MLCHQLDSKAYKAFDKNLINAIANKDYPKIIPDLNTKTCVFKDTKNDLATCDTLQRATDLALITINDLSNIRQATSW
jgi:hypothetical protein